MKKKVTLKRIVLFCIIAAVLVFAVGSIIGSGKPIFRQEESMDDWAAYFEDVTAPEGCELHCKGYGIGIEDSSASANAYYGYYWIIKTRLSESDLFAYYHPYAKEAGVNGITMEALLGYDYEGNPVFPIFPHNTSYKIDGLDEALSSLTQEDLLGNDYYIIYVIRSGS